MSRRNHKGRHGRWSPRRFAREFLIGTNSRKRTAFSFERLEDRYYFSVSSGVDYQSTSFSSDTPEGAAAIWQREMAWAELQASAAANNSSQLESRSLPSDPLFTSQWHLLNTGQEVGNPDFQDLFGVAGQDINVAPVWDLGYTGEGVRLAVIDGGIQVTHPDLIANLNPTLRFNALTGTNNPSPNFLEPAPHHGTAVAGLIGAVANNGIGGSGVAPGIDMVPIRLVSPAATDAAVFAAFQYTIQNDVDITNNSWGPAGDRQLGAASPLVLATLRDSVTFGRNGLGMIHVFASGNNAGPAFSPGFETFGNYDSASYDGFVNSRYTIGVTGVDHDGLYVNADGTFTSFAEAGSSVLVAAPSGSNVAQNVADDTGQGSGIWTTDLVGDFGLNAAPLPNGFDPDRDFLEDPDFTSRFGDTSASAALVSGVIALMLEANPNLTYRDVQEILVRSARQNAQFEIPSSGAGETLLPNTWQTNQNGLFRNPDPFDGFALPFTQVYFPLEDPNVGLLTPRLGHYESQPALFTNAAGYTVSQGYGVYAEQIGYAHGVIDAELAVTMAEQWHTLGQNLAPRTEKTFTTFVVSGVGTILAAEKGNNDSGQFLVPGAIGSPAGAGYIEYWNEYFADDPFADYDGRTELARGTHIEFSVPDNQAMEVEWVELKVDIAGPAEDLDYLRLVLVSPEGTHSELSNFYIDPDFAPFSQQINSGTFGAIDAAGDLTAGALIWTFSTNRSWGERTSDAVIINGVTGEPQLLTNILTGVPSIPLTKGWELHVENWSNSAFQFRGLEVVWHGKPIAGGTQRVQGFVGVDTNSDENFNYTRYVQSVVDTDFDPLTVRAGDVVRTLDLTQEPFAANQLVQAFRVVNGVAENSPTAQFLTGADGNYYLDLVPDEYVIRVSDPLGRNKLDDTNTSPLFLDHYRSEWHITPEWFFAPDRDNPPIPGEWGEIFYDDVANAPVAFLDGLGLPVATGVKNLNFLLKEDALPQEIVVNGTVFADLNGNGAFDGDDTPAGGLTVFFDENRNGVHDSGEQTVTSSDDANTRGQYSITIPAALKSTYSLGVLAPTADWLFTNPADGTLDIFAGPGDTLENTNFFLDPPDNAFPPAGANEPGDIFGVVFNDRNRNGVRNAGEEGIAGFRVFIDANQNGIFDAGEAESTTSANGSYAFANVAPGLIQLDIEEGNAWQVLAPASGFRQVQLGPGGTVQNVQFALRNLADRDWGDLPSSYNTLSATGGPSHVVVFGGNGLPSFYLGSKVDGEVDGQPTSDASGDDVVGQDDDGVVILSNNGKLQPGANVFQVTVTGIGGLLNGWIDWNDNGVFDANEHLTWITAGGSTTQVDLNPGTHLLTVNAPANIAGGPLAARFRWGEANLGPTGAAMFGEVEDYFLESSVAAALLGDYDSNGVVNLQDLVLWGATFGSTTDLRADGNKDGIVNTPDYIVWRRNTTENPGSGSSVASTSSVTSDSSAAAAVAPPAPATTPKILNWNYGNSPALMAWLNQSGLLSRYQAAGFVRGNFVVHAGAAQASSSSSVGGTTTVITPRSVGDGSVVTSNSPSVTTSVNVLPAPFARPNFRPAGRAEAAIVTTVATDHSELLLDQVWANFDAGHTDYSDEDSVVANVRQENEECVSDMALAAVMEDQSGWWSGN